MQSIQWRTFTSNPEAIASTFGNSDPSLIGVRLIKFELLEEGPTLNLHLALNDYPSRPPTRWASKGMNAVSLALQCFDLLHLRAEKTSAISLVSCEISRVEDGALKIHISGPGTEISICCDFIRVNHLTPYLKDRTSA